MMSQGKTPGKDPPPEVGLQGSEGSFQVKMPGKDPSDPCKPPRGSFPVVFHWDTMTDALSFYVTKTVLVGPKWFWSDQIDLDLTIMIWS